MKDPEIYCSENYTFPHDSMMSWIPSIPSSLQPKCFPIFASVLLHVLPYRTATYRRSLSPWYCSYPGLPSKNPTYISIYPHEPHVQHTITAYTLLHLCYHYLMCWVHESKEIKTSYQDIRTTNSIWNKLIIR